MLTRYYAFLENIVSIFKPSPLIEPPQGIARFCWFYLREAKGLLITVFGFTILLALAESYLMIVVGQFIDILSKSKPETLFEEHSSKLWFILIFILVIKPLINFIDETLVNQAIIPPLTNHVRWRAHLWVSGHSLSYFQNDFAGRLANRVVQVGPAVRMVAMQIINDMGFVIVFAITTLGFFIQFSWLMAMPILLWILLYGLLTAFYVPRAQELNKISSDKRSAIVGRIVDNYSNIHTLKLFAREDKEREGVREVIEAHDLAYRHTRRLDSTAVSLLNILNAVMLASVGYLSLHLWQKGGATAGDVSAMLTFALRLTHMSGWIMRNIREMFENIGTIEESMETIARPHDLVDVENAKDLTVTSPEITFENVSFHYGKGEGIIENLSFTVKSGEKLGIVGPSGAGKTTLTALLLRLHDVEAGKILVSGQDISQVTQQSLRANIGVVTQEPSLFHRSLHENIGFGKAGASRDEIIGAAKKAEAHEFICTLKDNLGREGYDAHVGERGVKLSGGQRQRIAIARVLLKNAPILVLDEATSALDSEIEAAIQAQLTTLMQGKTVLAIAHRLSTIAALDRLIVIDKGEIIESGTHAELLRQNGLYARLWARQSGGFLGEVNEH